MLLFLEDIRVVLFTLNNRVPSVGQVKQHERNIGNRYTEVVPHNRRFVGKFGKLKTIKEQILDKRKKRGYW
jgi:hypothetical protein